MTADHNIETKTRIAYFISPHGYGHAARAAAVMAAIQALDARVWFEIFTQIPRWFFQQSLTEPFGYHALLTDIGLAQKNSLVEDLPKTISRLNDFFPFDRQQIEKLARQINRLECQLIICDIAPMGIAVACEAGIPSALVENFTWDWIYRGYTEFRLRMSRHIAYLQQLFEAADYHIQTEPVCSSQAVDLTTTPVSRKVRSTPAQIRQKLGVPDQAQLVMISMGGLSWDYTLLEQQKSQEDIYLVIAGNGRTTKCRGNLIFLARDSAMFHPDLVNACDAVIGKTGYSTLAEVYQAGAPFGYISRPRFREAPVMEKFIQANMPGLPLTGAQLQNGNLVSRLPELLALPRVRRADTNGADQIAQFICNLPHFA